MKTPKLILPILLGICLLLAGCSDQPVNHANTDIEQRNLNLEESNFKLDKLAPSKADLQKLFESAKAKRHQKGNIAHYQFDIRLGSGPYDVVRIHRVVKERRSSRPIRTKGSVFMVAGSNQGFTNIFLNAGTDNPSPKTSAAYHLASKGIDVWGIDLGWSFVKPETEDFAFMQDWGIEKDADHTLAAMSIARFIRLLSGQGLNRMHLLGYSYGAAVAYTAAGMETQQHRFRRDISGIIPVDFAYKLDNVKLQQTSCDAADNFHSQLEAENYVNNNSGASVLGHLALTNPDGESQAIPIPGITNYQAPLFVALNPRPVSGWHFLGGTFNLKNLNFDLYHTEPVRWFQLLQSLPPYMPKLTALQLEATRCGENDVRIDDHLEKISVPILYIGATGGDGEEGYYTTTLTSSSDITTVTIEAPVPGMEDYGHADLFLAENAPDLVWEKLHSWLSEHDHRGLGPL